MLPKVVKNGVIFAATFFVKRRETKQFDDAEPGAEGGAIHLAFGAPLCFHRVLPGVPQDHTDTRKKGERQGAWGGEQHGLGSL